ncbi:hypothetical protein CYMTET_21813 [Cymbomonas tetramitiformis]|uniref:Uncharacterized protein n=1 Tax=Cymbomonas tetramitiformis TaxID=36881 RepID=A0AAE0BZF0_9CHLO|nr:hypothetical protein CYMTET_45494 [Cymbomonas tetramitiformis]KAK3269761.1 hypothetical protein CYMTET_21813 [Cymbomonas tetramitiformis]
MPTRDKRRLLKESDLEAARFDSKMRRHYQDQIKSVKDVRKENRHRAWGEALRMSVLGDKNRRFKAIPKDIDKLGKLVVALETEFQSVGLDVSSFDLENPTRVIEAVNELV